MTRFLILAPLLAVACDATVEGAADALPTEQAALPTQSLDFSILGAPIHGETFGFRVENAPPGASVKIIIGNGGLGGGSCPPVLGGGCVGFDSGSMGYRFVQGTADASGVFERTLTFPSTVPADIYQLQAWVYAAPGYDGAYSEPIELEALPSCAADPHEYNQTIATATPLTGPIADGQSCYGDSDWYSIDTPAGATVEVLGSYNASEGDLDLELANEQGDILDFSQLTSGSEVLLWYNSGVSTTTYVRAWTFLDDSTPGIGYSLTPTVVAPSPCVDDGNEDDDTLGTAQVAGIGQYTGQLCLGDDDWYQVAVPAGDEFQAVIASNPSDGDAELELYDAGGSILDNRADIVSATAQTAQDMYVRALLQSDDVTGGGIAYTADFSTISTGPCPIDQFEDNDTRQTASPLPIGTYSGLGACTNDRDYYAVTANAGQVISVSLLFRNADADVDVRILNSSGGVIESGVSATDNEILDGVAPYTGTYYIYVYVYADNGAPTTGGAVYTLDYDVN